MRGYLYKTNHGMEYNEMEEDPIDEEDLVPVEENTKRLN